MPTRAEIDAAATAIAICSGVIDEYELSSGRNISDLVPELFQNSVFRMARAALEAAEQVRRELN